MISSSSFKRLSVKTARMFDLIYTCRAQEQINLFVLAHFLLCSKVRTRVWSVVELKLLLISKDHTKERGSRGKSYA